MTGIYLSQSDVEATTLINTYIVSPLVIDDVSVSDVTIICGNRCPVPIFGQSSFQYIHCTMNITLPITAGQREAHKTISEELRYELQLRYISEGFLKLLPVKNFNIHLWSMSNEVKTGEERMVIAYS